MVTVTGLIRYFYDGSKRHPLKKDLEGKPTGTLLEYNIAVVLLPMGIIGAAIGSVVSLLIPMPISLGVFTLTLCIMCVSTLKKFHRMIKKENKTKREKRDEKKKEVELS
mmetsp:Transcript_55672/g.76596  ORF Transcript_55672/g.76596 Transcript_55672/m.76596 type:complete len:109 (-) Transcript_55672:1063-1389(-)